MTPVTGIYHHLGPKVTSEFINSLQAQGIVFDSGEKWLTFKAKELKDKQLYISSLIRLSRGRLVITNHRLVAIVAEHKIIDIPVDNPLFKNLDFDRNNPKRFTIKPDLRLFPGEITGQISLGYHIDPTSSGLPL
jgi:hypothetical protein